MTKEEPEMYVRLSTEYWSDKRGFYQKRCVKYLKRKSKGFNQLEDDAGMGEIELTFLAIKNFNQCDDGVYKVIVHAQFDCETGYCDEIEYMLEKVDD